MAFGSRLDDKLYKGEIHMVHQGPSGKYLVIGTLIEEDTTSPSFWGTDLLDRCPHTQTLNPKP